jgi:hypothetical protein
MTARVQEMSVGLSKTMKAVNEGLWTEPRALRKEVLRDKRDRKELQRESAMLGSFLEKIKAGQESHEKNSPRG